MVSIMPPSAFTGGPQDEETPSPRMSQTLQLRRPAGAITARA